MLQACLQTNISDANNSTLTCALRGLFAIYLLEKLSGARLSRIEIDIVVPFVRELCITLPKRKELWNVFKRIYVAHTDFFRFS